MKFFDTVQNYGKIVQLPGYGMTLHINGLLENYDFVGSIGSGYLNVNLRGSLMNAGEYAPYRTTFIDSNIHHLSALDRTPFGGEWYSDNSNGPVVALSDLVFKNAYINLSFSRNTILNANGHQLIFDSTRFYGTSVSNSDSLWFVNRTSVYNVDFLTTANIYGTMNLDNNVRFLDTLNNYGEIQNVLWFGRTLDVFGVLNNHAEIRSNPSSGSLTVRSYNDVFSNGLFNHNTLEFNGAASRTVFVNDYGFTTTRYWIRDTLSLTGDNFIPGILQPSNTNSRLWLANNTQLIAPELNFTNHAQIANQGRILTDKTINNATSARYNGANAQIYNYRNSDVQKQLIESYGHQTHPSVPDAADMWWRLRPTPFDAKDSLRELVLYYDEALLKNANEEKLKVYFSENAGLNWQHWTRGVNIDTAKNTITIANAPNDGHYILSDTSLGIIEYKPQLDRAEPRFFGNKGKITIYGFGLGLTPEMTVSIQMEGAAAIPADTSYLTDGKGESFLAVFNVESIPNGKYDLIITIPGENEMTLKEYFRVEKADRPDPWSMLTGRDRYLVNRWQTYNIAFGNKANVDAEMVPLFFVVKDIPGMEVEFPDVQIAVQNAFVDLGWREWQDTTMELYYTSDSLSGFEGQMMRIYPFIIPNISAYSAQSIRVRIKVPTVEDLEMAAWITDPLTEGLPMQLKKGMNADVAACLAAVAAKYAWDKAIGFIPGKDCFKLAYKIGEAGYNYVRKAPEEPGKPWTFYSLIDATWGWGWSVLDCAGKLTPVGYKYQLAKELVNTTFEMKNLYDADRECREKFKGKKKSKHRSSGAFSFDPNEIVGPTGYNDGQYISDGSHMVYTVYFENKDSATSAAMDVIVRDTLDKKLFDFETFSFQDVTIADSTYEIQGFAKEFRILVDLAPRIHTLVQITGGLDTTTGEILVTFYSVDRSTLEEQEDIDFGFLPPNKVSPQGEGNFVYSIGLKSHLPHQTEIPNQANIFFDFNKPIITNRFVNHIDTRPPNSYVMGLPAISNDSVFSVNWTGNDDGAGIEYYTIYVSENDSDYYSWVSGGISESAIFNGNNKYKYKFYSVATDSLGLGEEHPTVAQTSTEVDHLGVIKKLGQGDVDVTFYPNPARDVLTVNIKRGGNGHLTIYNMQGQVVKEMPVEMGSNAINISDLPRQSYLFKTTINGIYVLQVVVLQ